MSEINKVLSWDTSLHSTYVSKILEFKKEVYENLRGGASILFLSSKKRDKIFYKLTIHFYREYVYSVAVYQKYRMRLGELIIFEPWRENYHFSQPS